MRLQPKESTQHKYSYKCLFWGVFLFIIYIYIFEITSMYGNLRNAFFDGIGGTSASTFTFPWILSPFDHFFCSPQRLSRTVTCVPSVAGHRFETRQPTRTCLKIHLSENRNKPRPKNRVLCLKRMFSFQTWWIFGVLVFFVFKHSFGDSYDLAEKNAVATSFHVDRSAAPPRWNSRQPAPSVGWGGTVHRHDVRQVTWISGRLSQYVGMIDHPGNTVDGRNPKQPPGM